jgi:cyclophilin family peptidyl-prolyl cis-trans isomerase
MWEVKMRQKILVLAAAILFITVTASASLAGVVQVVVNGRSVDFPDTKPYINQDGRTMVPVRFISEQLGASVAWDEAAQKVNIEYKGKKILIPINEKAAYVDNMQIELDTEAVVVANRTMVPLRFVSEALGATVLWSSAASTVRISTSDANLTATSDRNDKYQSPPPVVIDPDKHYFGEIKTNRGDFKIELLSAEAPLTVNNFVFLAREGYYNGVSFHRVMKDFMVQTGDPLGSGAGGPGYAFNDELPPTLPYAPGIVAMANSGPNTNGSQFFICNGEQSKQLNVNPDYTVFGRVIEGMDVVLNISDTPVGNNGFGEMSKPMESVYIENISIEEI